MELRTARLRLRELRDDDLEPWAQLNADRRVRAFFPDVMTRDESRRSIERMREHFARHGFGMWALEVIESGAFIGSVGLNIPTFESHFTPCVELGWRPAFNAWGHGYATEAASAAVASAFDAVGVRELVAFTPQDNLRSRRVMEKLAMTHDPEDDFDHPLVPDGSRFKRQLLYRISRARTERR